MALAAGVDGHQAKPVFRSASNLIEVDAVVTGKNGAVVRGLTRDDFVLTEDGKPQPLAQFSFVDIPISQADPVGSRYTLDVVTNAPHGDRRVYAIVLDAFHVDAVRSTVVRRLAREFVEKYMAAGDVAAVLQFGSTTINQPFTSNKSLLVASIEQFIGRKAQSSTLNIMRDAMTRPPELGPAEDRESGARATDARIMLESLAQLCRRLGTSQGHRRSIVLFGEGVDFDTSDFIGADPRSGQPGEGLMFQASKRASEVVSAEADLVAAAIRANVALYTIDPRGNTMGDESMMQTPTAPGRAFLVEAQRGQGTMRTLASETGGLSVVGTGSFDAGFSHIVQANSSYYVLGYSPTGITNDGAYHRINVGVKDRDVHIAARKGYFAPPASVTSAEASRDSSVRSRREQRQAFGCRNCWRASCR